jgi:hypothetical protein
VRYASPYVTLKPCSTKQCSSVVVNIASLTNPTFGQQQAGSICKGIAARKLAVQLYFLHDDLLKINWFTCVIIVQQFIWDSILQQLDASLNYLLYISIVNQNQNLYLIFVGYNFIWSTRVSIHLKVFMTSYIPFEIWDIYD